MAGVSAVILAAGASTRMGAPKPLLELGGRTFVERAVDAFALAGVDDIVVVTGERAADVAAASAAGARPVRNAHPEEGMFSSVRAGSAAVADDRRLFVLPVDCPLVRPETVGRLARAAAADGAEVVLPAHDGRDGHPPLLGPGARARIATTLPGGGLRELIAGWATAASRVAVDDPGVLVDVDTPSDLEAVRMAAGREQLPSRARCLELLREQAAEPARVAHCRAVAAVARALAEALDRRSQYLVVPLVEAAALLHDIARARPHHAAEGATLLEELGYPRLAPLVRRHMWLGAEAGGPVDEAQVVYLADKLVQGDRPVSLDERFAFRERRVAGDPDAVAAVRRRRDEAARVQAKVEGVLGGAVADLAGMALSPGRT